jgi:hypothetical protein
MPVKYRNPSAGKKCDGVCDKCHKYSEFLFHNIGTFCEKCVSQIKKFRVRKTNFFKMDYCTICHKRPNYLYKINYGFCKKCLGKIGKRERSRRKEESFKNKRVTRRLHKKLNISTLDPKEAKKKEKELK